MQSCSVSYCHESKEQGDIVCLLHGRGSLRKISGPAVQDTENAQIVPLLTRDDSTKWRPNVYGSGGLTAFPRAKPTTAQKEQILSRQKNRCGYCSKPFGSIVTRKRKKITLRPYYDHFVPYSYSGRNPADNWVAACITCNSIKGSKMFNTKEDVVEYIRQRTD